MDSIILKIGGSILTEKHRGIPRIRRIRLLGIATAIARFIPRNPKASIILIHGGGSFGHPLAHQYQLMGRPLGRGTWKGFRETTEAMRTLTHEISEVLQASGVPVVPLHTASAMRIQNGVLTFSDPTMLHTIMGHHGVPLLAGDVVLTDKKTAIASGDAIAVAIARLIPHARILFATDVLGVFRIFPPRTGEKPLMLLTRRDLKKFRSKRVSRNPRDVTGAMQGKLTSLAGLRRRHALIFDGRTPENFAKALAGKPIGTRIAL